MKKLLLVLSLLALFQCSFAQNADTSSVEQAAAIQKILDRDKAIKYQTGNVHINSDVKLTVPAGYKFMSKADAEYVVFDFWGNPRSEGLLGMIVKQDYSIVDESAWAFVVTYENSGFVKDEDAEDIDYDEMMEELQGEEEETNAARVKEGYSAVHITGWAAKPFYDKKNNILHWAKSIKFGEDADTTLNYDVRILGRKGVLSLNAVGSLSQIGDIKKHVPDIIHIAQFKEGSRYTDFDPEIDKVAAYTIGGLVAGKLLAKVGLFALLLKNIKLVIFALIAIFGALKNRILGLFSKKAPALVAKTTSDPEPEAPEN
ncbi:DUF2167 domain-containing protein [Dyadobacter pollutisoli]|jgi:uncharacterized membrane-anchored protein|uniref:DUF2167 domain-containing protein n=1 Tax=Dyadobacter pollutisoli TaxID=2910158 RepID=A0A9E8SL70_9BACT|nr:DUF2167 domain-containing protein [Dyadobacter pollutisoli]WAC11506.1 DUF2167 domain-containing protein [Dyadobacter pollutisoli]